MSTPHKRPYVSPRRDEAAEVTRARVLTSAKTLFARRGIDGITVAQIAQAAKVAVSTVYSLYRSKEGLLYAMMSGALFGPHFEQAEACLVGVEDPVELMRVTARVARSIYERERAELGSIRSVSAFSPALKKLERKFETIRFEMQRERIERLFACARQKRGLTLERARHVMWMYTSREVFRMFADESGWTADEYETWLAETLTDALVEPLRGGGRPRGGRSSSAATARFSRCP